MARTFNVYNGDTLIKRGLSPLELQQLEPDTTYDLKISASEFMSESEKVAVPLFKTLPQNILPQVTAKTFTLGTGATVKDGVDGEVIFTLDGTNQLLKYDTTFKLPQLTEGKTYKLSVDIKFHNDVVGDVRNLRLSYNYIPGGAVMLETPRPITDTTKDKWIKIQGTKNIKYEPNTPTLWYLVFQDLIISNRITGTISLKNFQVFEVKT